MQYRFVKFKDNLVSDDTNNSKSGIIPGAVYRGFDEISGVSGLNFNIDHEVTGEIRPNIQEVNSSPMGVWVSNQGVTIKEDAAIPLIIITNVGNTSYRNDYVIGRHHHDVIYNGGVVATYQVIQGPVNSDTLPVTISGNDWVILGILRIPPNAADATTIVFTRSPIPSLGNQFPALLGSDNRFTAQQQENQGPSKAITSSTIDTLTLRGSIADLIGGNLFPTTGYATLDLLPDRPVGTRIALYFSQDTILRPFVSQLTSEHITAGYSAGLRAIVIDYDTTDNLIIKANQIATFVKYNKGDVYADDNLVFGDFWKLIDVSDTPAMLSLFDTQLTSLNTALTALTTAYGKIDPIGTVKIYGGDTIDTDFDATGLGISDDWVDWAIQNGQNETDDWRGRVLVNMTNADPNNYGYDNHLIRNSSDYIAQGQNGGEEKHILVLGEMPAHAHPINTSNSGLSSNSNADPMRSSGPGSVNSRGSEVDGSGTIEQAGEGLPHENRQPYIVTVFVKRIAKTH